jgi:integrase
VEANVRPYQSDGGRADPGDLKTHDLRHSVANWMLSETDEHGSPKHRLVDVKNRLRHSSIVTTDTTYNHFKRR